MKKAPLWLWLSVCLVGCKEKAAPPARPPLERRSAVPLKGSATPEAAYHLWQVSFATRNWRDMFALIHPEHVDQALAIVWRDAVKVEMESSNWPLLPTHLSDEGSELYDLSDRHHVPLEFPPSGTGHEPEALPDASIDELARQLASVPDKGELFADWQRYGRSPLRYTTHDGAVLERVDVKAEAGVGTLRLPSGEIAAVYFRKHQGLWYVAFRP